MKKVWSLTKLVITEAIRKRLALLLGITCAIILLVPFVIPSQDPEGQIQIIESWLFSCIGFFGVVAVLFIVGTSLPRDLREGRLTMLFTKPVNRSSLLLSKFMGYAIVLFLFVVVTGAVGYLILLGFDLTNEPFLLSAREKISSQSFQFDQKRDTEQSTFRGGLLKEDDQERIIVYGTNTTSPIAVWTFNKQPGRNYQRPPELILKFQGRGPRDQYSIRLKFFVMVPQPVSDENEQNGPSYEWRRVQREIKNVRKNRTSTMTILPEVYERRGKTVFDLYNQFRVEVALANPAATARLDRNSVQLTGPHGFFFRNYLKALFLTYLLLLFLTGFLMAVSTVLSAPISICLGLLFYFIGSLSPFFQDALTVTKAAIQHRGSQGPRPGHHHMPHAEFPTWMLQYSRFVTENVLSVMPDFGVFSQQALLMRGWRIPNSILFNGTQTVLLYTVCFLGAGILFFHARELES